jgi:hypothetical protein
LAAIWTDDVAARWLLDLLALLPAMTAGVDGLAARRVDPNLDPAEVEESGAQWWDMYAKAHEGPLGEGGYYRAHLLPYALRIVNGTAREEDTRHLAEYCLLFFDVAHRPECCKLLEEAVVTTFPPKPEGSAGQRWAQSVVEAAWRLWVPRQARNRLREGLAAWPVQRTD